MSHTIPALQWHRSRAHQDDRTGAHQPVPLVWGRRLLQLAAPVMSSSSGEEEDRHLDPAFAGARPYLTSSRGLEDARLLSSCRASRPLEVALGATQILLRVPSQQLVRLRITPRPPQLLRTVRPNKTC